MDKEKWKNLKDIKPLEKRNKTRFVYPDKTILDGIIVDEIRVDTRVLDKNTTGKFYRNLVQKIIWNRDSEREHFRFCYYYINFDNDNPRWIFGQYAPTFSNEKLKELVNKMKEKGWII